MNAPLPVTSPITQSPSPGAHPVVDLDGASGRVEADGLEAEVVEVGVAAGGDQQLVGAQLLAVGEGQGERAVARRRPGWSPRRSAPGCPRGRTRPPAARRPPARRPATDESPCWTTVTCTPNRAKTWASSQPIGPPPRTTSEPGQRGDLHGVAVGPERRALETRHAGPRRPGAGVEDDAACRRRTPSRRRRAPSRRPGRDRPAGPRRAGRWRRRASSRSTATRSSQWSVACTATRSATGAQLDVIVTSPDSSVGPPGLGHQVGGPDHHLGRDAAVVGALAAHQVLVHRDDSEPSLRGGRGQRLSPGPQPDDHQIHLLRVCHGPSLPHCATVGDRATAGRAVETSAAMALGESQRRLRCVSTRCSDVVPQSLRLLDLRDHGHRSFLAVSCSRTCCGPRRRGRR